MAIIHKTTLTPTKLELLTAWLPSQPWYAGSGSGPELTKAGGFRLDDPAGEVGIEFMIVTDAAGEPVAYHVPMAYRAEPLDGADGSLIGTTEHGVLGRRWVYDGLQDPVLVAQLVALFRGQAEPQAQSISDTPDDSVIVQPMTADVLASARFLAISGTSGTDLQLETAAAGSRLILRVSRALQADEGSAASGGAANSGAANSDTASSVAGQPRLSAIWAQPDGTVVRGILARARSEAA
jgi:hypothetical protein